MRKKCFAALALALVLTVPALCAPAQAAGTVSAALPAFPVTLNGQTVSNDHSRYPLLVYRDITYFPMTYYDARLLGLRTDWTPQTGLEIGRNDAPFYEYVREVTDKANARTQQARIAQGPIRVNGTAIDNDSEPYPLLLFRDVTYFPLTWRFAVEAFGWTYTFDLDQGLVITNPDAPFETPQKGKTAIVEDSDQGTDPWALERGTWLIGTFGGAMGMGNLPLHCRLFDNGKTPSLGLYNLSGKDLVFPQDPDHWEYRIYRQLPDGEELVYRKALPFFNGTLPASIAQGHWASSYLDVTYWKTSPPDGIYRSTLAFPEAYAYRTADSGQLEHTSVLGDRSPTDWTISRTFRCQNGTPEQLSPAES